MSLLSLEFGPVSPAHGEALAAFFAALAASGDDRFFHPHPFTAAEATRIAGYAGKDLYLVARAGDEILAYGMLRGWEEGYSVPSLGVAVHPAARGSGLARAFMLYLHAAARVRGSKQVRLKVYPENVKARALYERLGYRFGDMSAGQLIGICPLEAAA